jgi:hypothetical protein
MNNNNLRKEKEREFYMQHMDAFKAIGLADPFFTIKTAFFKKGKFGRQCQFFEWELKKGDDIYIEFYENVYDSNGKNTNVIPMLEERQLFKLKFNPFYHEEYDVTETVEADGKVDRKYLVPVNEMVAVLPSGQEISYALYEKRKEDAKLEIPQLQKSLSIFPDFEQEFAKRDEVVQPEGSDFDIDKDADTSTLANISLRDFAAIMLVKPVSDKQWLNDLIKQAKSEI